MIIYMLINKNNGKKYIGKTARTLQVRLNEHKCEKRDNAVIHKAIRKNGMDSFEVIVLDNAITDELILNELETFYILKYDTFIPNGYNLTLGGEGMMGHIVSEETRKKLSKSLKGLLVGDKNGMFGRKHTPEARAKIKEKRKNQIFSEETRAKMSRNGKGRKLPPFSEEHKRKLSEKAKERYAKNPELNPFYKNKISLGRKHKPETIEKLKKIKKEWWNNKKKQENKS